MSATSATAVANIILPFPLASIIPYMGPQSALNSLATQGWQLCDGRALSASIYSALYDVIGTTYGGNGNPSFQLPNLVGMFLRGVDATGAVDPDYAARTSPIPGNSTTVGGVVGSRQADQLKNHMHNWSNNFGQISDGGSDINVQLCQNGGNKGNNQGTGPTTDTDGGGNETRPVNVYVFYLMFTGLLQINPASHS
jgi:microcystin-dependent protein